MRETAENNEGSGVVFLFSSLCLFLDCRESRGGDEMFENVKCLQAATAARGGSAAERSVRRAAVSYSPISMIEFWNELCMKICVEAG